MVAVAGDGVWWWRQSRGGHWRLDEKELEDSV